MLIDITQKTILDPTKYPKRLVVLVPTHGNPNCGVFFGNPKLKNAELRLPTIENHELTDLDLEAPDWELFEVLCPSRATPGTVQRSYYAVTKWHAGSYVSYPTSEVLQLEDRCDRPWLLHFKEVTLVLPDYTGDR